MKLWVSQDSERYGEHLGYNTALSGAGAGAGAGSGNSSTNLCHLLLTHIQHIRTIVRDET